MSSIEKRLRTRLDNQLLDLAAKHNMQLEVSDSEWQEIVDAYKLRGEGEPAKPLMRGIPIVRRTK